jgi:hypothetical protein
MDEELRRALRRVEPPEGFADRVLQSASRSQRAQPASPKPAWWFTTQAKAGAIAATVAFAIAGGAWYRAEERRKEGEEAKRQVLLSLNIAGSKLHAIAIKVNHGEER